MRACHIRDGAAESEFFSWLEEEIQIRDISEVEIDEKINYFREVRGGGKKKTIFFCDLFFLIQKYIRYIIFTFFYIPFDYYK